jgi:hypothetical protein
VVRKLPYNLILLLVQPCPPQTINPFLSLLPPPLFTKFRPVTCVFFTTQLLFGTVVSNNVRDGGTTEKGDVIGESWIVRHSSLGRKRSISCLYMTEPHDF